LGYQPRFIGGSERPKGKALGYLEAKALRDEVQKLILLLRGSL
jgi:hypothetical protein